MVPPVTDQPLDPDPELVLSMLDGREAPAAEPAPTGEFLDQLDGVRAVIGAFERFGVADPGARPPCESWGPFKLEEQVGRGRFGAVCRAFDAAVQRDVAVKLYSARELPNEP